MRELNTMLAELAEDGSLDSTGVFTLSLERADEKLAAYRLANPGLFVLNLLAAAVTGGATAFSVETNETTTSFRFDSKLSYSDDQLEGIFAYILKPSAPAHLRELALALHGARALPDSPVINLQVNSTGSSRELTMQGESISTGPGTLIDPGSEGAPGVVLRITYAARGGWAALFSRRHDRSHEVLQQLFHFCRYAPLRLSYNGQPQGLDVVLGGSNDSNIFAWRLVPGQQALRLGTIRQGTRQGEYPRRHEPQVPTAVPSTFVIGLGTPKVASDTGLLLVSRGVVFRRPIEVLGFPVACAVVTADHLEKNLSQSDLVEGAEYEALLEAVRSEVRDLVLEVCANPPSWPSPATGAAFTRALDSHFGPDEPAPLVVDTFRRRRAIEDSCRDADAQSEQMSYWRALTGQDSHQAEEFRNELTPAVTRQATRRLSQAQWREAALYLVDLYELLGKAPDALLVVVMILADQGERAQKLLSPQSDGNSTLLEYLLGWGDELDEDLPMAKFLRFQRAVDLNELETADALAKHLEGCRGTAFLFLWLGWYQLFRDHHERAAELWEKALALLPTEERERWANILWPQLSGKLSLLQQVRWQARRSLEGLHLGFGTDKAGSNKALTQTFHPARWAKNVWGARLVGQNEQARDLFVKGYLAGLINPQALRLERVDSRYIPLAPFRGEARRV